METGWIYDYEESQPNGHLSQYTRSPLIPAGCVLVVRFSGLHFVASWSFFVPAFEKGRVEFKEKGACDGAAAFLYKPHMA